MIYFSKFWNPTFFNFSLSSFIFISFSVLKFFFLLEFLSITPVFCGLLFLEPLEVHDTIMAFFDFVSFLK